MNYLPGNIRYLRKKAGQNQAELARNFGKKQNTVGNWENGVSEPSIKELVALSQIFMVGMEELINRDLEKKDLVSQDEKEAGLATEEAGLPDSLLKVEPTTAREKEMDGFWLTLRELRRLHEKLDSLIALQERDRGKSIT